VSDEVRQVQPDDDEIAESWLRETGERELRAVEANRIDEIGGWQVTVWVMEHVRSGPLEAELRQRIAAALQGVRGVTSVEEQDREMWFVTGAPAGKALAEAAAMVVDELAGRTRAYYDSI